MALIFGYISRYAVLLPRSGAIIPVSQKAPERSLQKRNSKNILTLSGILLPSLFLIALMCVEIFMPFSFEGVII